VFEVLAAIRRRLTLRAAIAAGTITRWTERAVGPPLRWLLLATAVLALSPALLNWLSRRVGELGVWTFLEVQKTPHLGTWWSWRSAVTLAGAALLVRWLLKARRRYVIEQFVDYTTAESKAVGGLATLLVTELGRLRELYGRVNEQLAVPTSVGVRSQSGTSGGSEAGAFLTVRADDVSNVLESAVASEAKLDVGPVKLPIGPFIAALGRLVRGPRVLGSVHWDESGGGPTLTAHVIGTSDSYSWRIDTDEVEPGGTVSRVVLNEMVAELALRMFTDMTLRRSIRWKAVRAFTEYLELYWESLRTPRNRAGHLKQAEAKLLEAVSEDDGFDLAYYNLGVIYSQLAETERLAAEGSDFSSVSSHVDDPEQAHRARSEAAMAAFSRALALNRARTEAVYGLAVHSFTRHLRQQIHEKKLSEESVDRLERVIRLCDRVLELDRKDPQAFDLKGMALLERGEPSAAIMCHRLAVEYSWRRLRRAEYDVRAGHVLPDVVLPRARANAAAALQNLAMGHSHIAVRHLKSGRATMRRRLRFFRSDRVFHQAFAGMLTPPATRAAAEFERGRMRSEWGRHGKAAESFSVAARIETENPVHAAHLAKAYACLGRSESATASCTRAIALLAPVYKRVLEPFPPAWAIEIQKLTIDAVTTAYGQVGEAQRAERVGQLRVIGRLLAKAEIAQDIGRLTAIASRYESDRYTWEHEQVTLVLARVHAACEEHGDAARIYNDLIRALSRRNPERISQHSLHAKHARALRALGHPEEALQAATRGVLKNPLDAEVRHELAWAHFDLQQLDDAVHAWEQTLWLTPNDPLLQWQVGFCHWSLAQDRQHEEGRKGSLEEASRCFERSILLSGPERLECWAWSKTWLGRVWTELGRTDEAIVELRAAQSIEITQLPAVLLLAEAHEANGDLWLSHGYFQRAYLGANKLLRFGRQGNYVDAGWGNTLLPWEVEARALVGIAHWVLEAEERLDYAARIAEYAEQVTRQIESDHRGGAATWARALDLQARVCARQGKMDRALELSRKARRVNPNQVTRALEETLTSAAAEGMHEADRLGLLLTSGDPTGHG
jgi:tetratricopeptide (TPR) repeat protein